MKAEIICVGTELLLGNIVNTNAAYLGEKCAQLGLSCYYHSAVGDNMERLCEVLEVAYKRSDVIILSGGLGPTEDDLTKEAAAKVMEKQLVMHEESKDFICKYFEKRGVVPTENNWKQALIPEGAIVLKNNNGTAPGIIICKDNKHVVLLPGPPGELKPMFEESVAPYLRQLEPEIIYSKTVKLCGVGESRAETMMLDLIDSQTDPTIATYAKIGEVHIRVTTKATNEKEAKKKIKPIIQELKNRFGDAVYTTKEEVTLEKAIIDLLIEKELSFSCAESCTGGMLSSCLINVPGVSDVYKAGYITYSNKAKKRILGVKSDTLNTHGAVSKETAEEMAKGACDVSKTDVSLAITGIAGPEGGTPDKPVGLVYISCKIKGKTITKEYGFVGNRESVRMAAVSSALVLLRKSLLEYK